MSNPSITNWKDLEPLAYQQFSTVEPLPIPTEEQYKSFHARWQPAIYRAGSSPVSTGKHETYYYSPYGGWNSGHVPILFKSPGEAICWGISRFKRDGLSNSWGPGMYPDFLRFVFLASFRLGASIRVPLPSASGRRSKNELAYFEPATFHQVDPDTELLCSGYRFTTEEYFQQCANTMKTTPDWMCSSHSIYKRECRCIVGGFDQIFQKRDARLSCHRTRFKFVQLENNFCIFKFNTKRSDDHGKSLCIVYCFISTWLLINVDRQLSQCFV